MTVDTRLFNVVTEFRAWATNKPNVRRMWIYGSRLLGTQRPDSDLDTAIEIDVLSTDAETQLKWMDDKEMWLKELQNLSPFKVHLEMHGTPHVNEYVASCSMLIYKRAI